MNNRTFKIPKIERYHLPENYPTEAAMKSWGHNKYSYLPDIWEMEYCSYRLLGRMTEQQLLARYHGIVRNMPSYTAPERDIVPIISYQSSWYWYRKEHLTRLEFALRGFSQPELQNIVPLDQNSEVVPNGTTVLYRYGKREYMQQMVEEGRIRFSPAEAYEGDDNNDARRDDERRKHSFTPGEYLTITSEDGRPIPILCDMQRTVTGAEYSLVCFSSVWDERLFDEFKADTCVIIHAPEEFLKRIGDAGMSVYPGWYYHHNPVQYFDPYEQRKNEYFDASMSKDFSYAYQNEYRTLWSRLHAGPVDGYQFVDIGPAHDIMRMYDRDKQPILIS
ncbi:MAG: hypothetical protein HWE30_04895 [Methylocystaceae bacterium]|nr:hypothetical protein [Methylocystaceae bacterium]